MRQNGEQKKSSLKDGKSDTIPNNDKAAAENQAEEKVYSEEEEEKIRQKLKDLGYI